VGRQDSHTVGVGIVLHEGVFRRKRRAAFPTFKRFSHDDSPRLHVDSSELTSVLGRQGHGSTRR
jgi:hypothetical protein